MPLPMFKTYGRGKINFKMPPQLEKLNTRYRYSAVFPQRKNTCKPSPIEQYDVSMRGGLCVSLGNQNQRVVAILLLAFSNHPLVFHTLAINASSFT
jgi:hypothetical protein